MRLVLHDRNRGKGAAVRTALEHARGTYATVMDADLEYDPKSIAALVRAAAARGRRGGLRRSRLRRRVGVQLLVRPRQQGRDDDDERPVQHVARRHHDLPEGAPHRALAAAELRESGFAFEAEITARLARAGCGSTRCPSPTARAAARTARSSRRSTGCACCARSSGAGSTASIRSIAAPRVRSRSGLDAGRTPAGGSLRERRTAGPERRAAPPVRRVTARRTESFKFRFVNARGPASPHRATRHAVTASAA